MPGHDGPAAALPPHPAAWDRQREGFFGYLTPEQEQKLEEMRGLVTPELELPLWLCPVAETSDQFLLRFLRARNFNTSKAWAMLTADLDWRREKGILGAGFQDPTKLSSLAPRQVLGTDPRLLASFFPSCVAGVDKQGRPIIIKRYGSLEVAQLLEFGVTVESLVRMHIYENEHIAQLLSESSKRLGCAAVSIPPDFVCTA